MKFRKKPLVIEARQLSMENLGELIEWCDGWSATRPPMRAVTGIGITTLDGDIYASFGDWIIKGVKGEFYFCKPDIFEKTYEKVEESNEIEKIEEIKDMLYGISTHICDDACNGSLDGIEEVAQEILDWHNSHPKKEEEK